MLKDYLKRNSLKDPDRQFRDGFFNERKIRREKNPTEETRKLVVETLSSKVDGKTVKDHIVEFLSGSRSAGEEIHTIWIKGARQASTKLNMDLALDRADLREALQVELGDSAGESGTLLTELLRNVLFGTSEKGRDETVLSLSDSLRRKR
jgi:hypothetical protein